MNNSLSTLVKGLGNTLLKNPGDKLEAYVTRTGRQVVKLQQNHYMTFVSCPYWEG